MPADLAFTIEIVDASIADAAARGDGTGLLGLRRRLQAVSSDPPPPRTRRDIEQAQIELERDSWVEAIGELLLPAVRDSVVTALRNDVDDQRGGDHERRSPDGHPNVRDVTFGDPWAELDPHALQARHRAVEVGWLRTQRAATEACRHYERTRKTSHLRDAVRELESARELERHQLASGLVVSTSGEQADRLGRALGRALPPPAFRFFAAVVREHIGTESADGLARPRRSPARGAEQQWLSRDAWTARSDTEGRVEGVWFVDWLQALHDGMMELVRLDEEAEGRRRQEAHARFQEWQALRDEEARSARTEAEKDRKVESLDAESSSSSAESAAARSVERAGGSRGPIEGVEAGLRDERCSTADARHGRLAPHGSASEAMHPAMAAAVEEERKRRAIWDAELARREADREEYRHQLVSRR